MTRSWREERRSLRACRGHSGFCSCYSCHIKQVDPSDVRRQKGPFEEDFVKLVQRFGENKVVRWRRATEKAGDISDWDSRIWDEEQLVQRLVKRISTELSNTPIRVAACTVGLNSRVEQLVRLLDVKSRGILVLGLHGMGGVGKTTLAKAVYNKFVGQFEHRSFISNVREISGKDDGLISLQKKLIDDLYPDNKVVITNEVKVNIEAIKRILEERKVIAVFDDVDDISQLNALCGKKEWFCEGSRIIITTRDRGVLPENYAHHEVQKLDPSESLRLFSYHALRREKPADQFLDLSKQIVSLTGGLPLALEVFGAFLFDKRTIPEWEDAMGKLRKIRPDNLQGILKISFDGLDEQDRCIFLDIACLFVEMEMKREEAIDILKGCGFRAEIAISVLVAKSLIRIAEDDTLWMHDQLRDMGRQIVQQENLLDAGQRSRLWDRHDIMSVLMLKKGTRSIQGIVLDFKEGILKKKNSSADTNFWGNHQHGSENERETILYTESFESMVSLRLLQINYIKLEGKFKFLPADLKWLQWKKCTVKTLPSDFCPFQLAVLDLSNSAIEHVWSSYTNKVAKNLMVMNFRGCWNLAAIPDLSEHQILEKLVLEGCIKLTKIHESVGNMSKLLHLNLRACSSLIELPSDVSGLKHLEKLILSRCSKLKNLPENLGSMRSLKELLLDGTAIEKLPKSIFYLVKLEKLNLDNCQLLKQLPECIGKLDALKELSLNHSAIEELPDSVGSLANLEQLSLIGCGSVTAIPDSIGNLKSLIEFLNWWNCYRKTAYFHWFIIIFEGFLCAKCQLLCKLPESIEGLASLVELS
ncbi:disease resistance protein TAO1-like [Pistacia vera]|uniref:disease resistance protein TAO1-like n=1 Tax=Pistacia vera TaxID=55513 RepID=UPI0012638097|nr:disease resistance protein TAO1-like [Pistacia vera]